MIKEMNVEVPLKRKRVEKGKIRRDIYEFLESGAENCEVDATGYKSANSCQTSYQYAVKRDRLTGQILVARRDGRVFLIRGESLE